MAPASTDSCSRVVKSVETMLLNRSRRCGVRVLELKREVESESSSIITKSSTSLVGAPRREEREKKSSMALAGSVEVLVVLYLLVAIPHHHPLWWSPPWWHYPTLPETDNAKTFQIANFDA